MTIFESKVLINKSIGEVYSFLEDFNNHESLMPENVSNWSSSKDDARFSIQNMANIALKVASRTPNKEILIVPAEEAPIALSLKWSLNGVDGKTEAKLAISAELNMMMKMLASGPLQKLADHQTKTLSERLV